MGWTMKHAETVTFGGSGLDRAGEVRSDREAVATLQADSAARAILFWRGKILVDPARPAKCNCFRVLHRPPHALMTS